MIRVEVLFGIEQMPKFISGLIDAGKTSMFNPAPYKSCGKSLLPRSLFFQLWANTSVRSRTTSSEIYFLRYDYVQTKLPVLG